MFPPNTSTNTHINTNVNTFKTANQKLANFHGDTNYNSNFNAAFNVNHNNNNGNNQNYFPFNYIDNNVFLNSFEKNIGKIKKLLKNTKLNRHKYLKNKCIICLEPLKITKTLQMNLESKKFLVFFRMKRGMI